ncbi:MAG: exo-alpha-sialidase [Betaproteobacteria bacterium]|nr:exo-alpha-sialidase [Betaproteobacteria bacterium]
MVINAKRRAIALGGGLAALTAGLPAALAQHAGHHGASGVAGKGAGGARPDLGATAAFDAQGVLWAAHKDGAHIAVSRSEDAGRSWSVPMRVNSVIEATDMGADSRPKIALGAGGEIYVSWTRPLGKPYTGEIRFARSLDGGRTFSKPLTVHADRQEITHRFDAMAVNNKGQLFVAWIDKRDGVAAARARGPEYRGAAVYYAVSDDRGASFRGDFRLAEHSCECCRIALRPQADGSVLAMWRHVFAPNIRDHALARMTPEGSPGEIRRVTFDDWRVDVCPHHGPSLDIDAGGRLHAVWFTQAANNSGVFYGRLRDGGVDLQRRIGGTTAEHADLAIIGNRVAVAWKEFDGERSHLRALLSDDAGEHWRERELVATSEASDHPRVLARAGAFHVFWNTRREPLLTVALA